MLVVDLGARDRAVDGLAEVVTDKRERGTSVGDGGVARAGDGLVTDLGGGRGEAPEALRAVDGRVGDLLALGCVLVDVAEGVEAGGIAGGGRAGAASGRGGLCGGRHAGGAQVGGEELGRLGNVLLGDHVLNKGVHGLGLDGVDVALSSILDLQNDQIEICEVLQKQDREVHHQVPERIDRSACWPTRSLGPSR